jgi:hypothetical protein
MYHNIYLGAGALVVWAVTAWSTRKGRLGALKMYHGLII